MSATQRIVRVRRQYNQWVADQSLEDYALRFTGHVARRWSHFRVTNTAIGSISFLALEAIGGLITLQYGFTNAVYAIAVVSHAHFPELACDRILRRKLWPRHRPSDQRRWIRLSRLLALVVDLRDLHLRILCDRGRHHGGCAGDGIGDSAAGRLRVVLAHHHSAGCLRHHADKPSAVMDPADLDRPATGAVSWLWPSWRRTTSGTGSTLPAWTG